MGKYFYLPDAHTDSIFSILAQETGLLGAGAALFGLAYLTCRCFDIAHNAPDKFGALLAAGAGTFIGLQAVINVGAQTGLLPLTGVPLPFLSYGGSALLSACCLVGLALSVSRRPKG